MEIKDIMGRFGQVRIESHEETMLAIVTEDPLLMEQLYHTDAVRELLAERIGPKSASFKAINRGLIKQAMIKIGYPAVDAAGYAEAMPLDISLRQSDLFTVRPYQIMARDAFYKGGSALGGNGVVVLPCGAGKTVVGMAIMDLIKSHTLILTTGITAVRQWKRELIEKMNINPEDVGEYSGEITSVSAKIASRLSSACGFSSFTITQARPATSCLLPRHPRRAGRRTDRYSWRRAPARRPGPRGP